LKLVERTILLLETISSHCLSYLISALLFNSNLDQY
jgi:hypothetical protein